VLPAVGKVHDLRAVDHICDVTDDTDDDTVPQPNGEAAGPIVEVGALDTGAAKEPAEHADDAESVFGVLLPRGLVGRIRRGGVSSGLAGRWRGSVGWRHAWL
jgi:hypothetical protein